MYPPKPFLHQHIPKLFPSQMVENCFSTINVQVFEGGRYFFVETSRSTTLFRSVTFNVHLIWMEKGGFLECHPLFIKRQIHAPISSGNSCLNNALTPSLVNLGSLTLNPPPYVDKFWKILQMEKAWNDHMTSIFLASWEICLDYSMSIWHSRWTFPGCIFCPRKPHQFGN